MKLQEVFDQLSAGEFSQLSIGGAAAGVLDESNYSKVVGHVNLGLTALFTRFNLRERSITFPLQADSETYQFNITDILKIEKVMTDGEIELGLNDAADPYSCTTPTMRSLRVADRILQQGSDLPEELKTTNLTVTYRANHPKIVMGFGYFDPVRVDVQLPESHLEALLYFVASRVNNPIGMTSEFHAGNSYAAKYELACQQLEQKNLQVDIGGSNMRLSRGGWV